MATFSCAILGPSNSGKTAFLQRTQKGIFVEAVTPDRQEGEYELDITFLTDAGENLTFQAVETPHEATVVDCVLIILDKATLTTPAHLHTWVTSARQRYGEVPLVVCGTKIDLLQQYGNAISRSLAPHVHALGVTYYDLSSKTNYNLEKPWVYLSRQLTGNPDLRLP